MSWSNKKVDTMLIQGVIAVECMIIFLLILREWKSF